MPRGRCFPGTQSFPVSRACSTSCFRLYVFRRFASESRVLVPGPRGGAEAPEMAVNSLRLAAAPASRLGASRSEFSSLCRLGRSPSAQPSLVSCVRGSGSQHTASTSLAAGRLSQGRLHDAAGTPLAGRCQRRDAHRGPMAARAVATPLDAGAAFEEMVAGTARKYYMVGGKGGVGKTSISASLAVKFANAGQPTLVVSTDPAHSLSDSFAQDVSGGLPVMVEGTDSMLYAMEIDPEKAREEFRAATTGEDGSAGVKDFMDSMGLGSWLDQLSELKLGELLDTPPPGLDEAVAIAKVVQFMQAEEYGKFTRIVFDTAPTGHTLRLLSLPDFLDASIGKILKLKAKITSATSAVKSMFGQGEGAGDKAVEWRSHGTPPGTVDPQVDKLEQLKERMGMVRDIFRNKETTEFVIVTIPTVMAINESSRLLKSLEAEDVPAKRLVVNQILPASTTDCKFCNIKRKDQQRALQLVRSDVELSHLQVIEAPLFDVEIRGVPALRFMGDVVWK